MRWDARSTRLAATVLLLACCGELPDGPRRALVVGIDGLSPERVEELFQAGRLPTLQRLAREGTWGRLRSIPPLVSPRIWNSVATGKMPEQHGILGFVHKSEGGRRLYLSTDRAAHALWNIASDRGRSVGVVHWWNTFPVPRVEGIVVSDHALAGPLERHRRVLLLPRPKLGPTVFPPEYEVRAREALEDPVPPVDVANPFATGTALPDWADREKLSRFFREDGQIARVALHLESDLHPDLLMVLLPGVDRISHWLWGVFEPGDSYPPRLRPSRRERRAGTEAMHRYHEFVDALVGALVERFDSEDLVLVVSDHGFEGLGPGARLTEQSHTGRHITGRALHGVFVTSGSCIASNAVGQMHVLQVAPTVLACLGLPVPRDMDSRPPRFVKIAWDEIETYEGQEIDRLPANSGMETQMLDRLRELGYVE